jgi:flagellar biosynthesis anti-sigma factor FlgM
MRIDLNAIIPEAPEPGQSAKSGAQAASARPTAEGVGGGDTARLSYDHGRAQNLAVQVNQFPEIRQDRVAALQRALTDGSYQVTPAQSAEALISAMQIRSAA